MIVDNPYDETVATAAVFSKPKTRSFEISVNSKDKN